MLTLGLNPLELTVLLSRDGAFVATLVADVAWPAGTGIALRFSAAPGGVTTATWPATVAGVNAGWDVPPGTVAAVLDSAARTVRLVYTEADGTALIWAKGVVGVH